MFCQGKFGVVLLRCYGGLSLHNRIFNSPYVKKLENLQLNLLDICWFDKIKYLGMQTVSGKSL